MAHIKSPPNWVIGLYSLGFLWLCLGGKRLKGAALAIFAVCIGSWVLSPVPDMRISDDDRIAIWNGSARETLYVGSNRADRYGREQFAQRAGASDVNTESYEDTLGLCDALACRLNIKGKTVSILSHPSEVPEECRNSSLVVLTNRDAGPGAKRQCGAVLIGDQALKRGGAHDVYLKGDEVRAVTALTERRAARPWGVWTYRRD